MMTHTAVQTGYAPVNSLRMYYEVHGSGQPLIVVHGGLGMTGMFVPLLPELAPTWQVIVFDLQGHGHTADIDRPFSFEQFGDDIATLVKHLGFGRVDVMGYSLGGGGALQTAIRHPDLVCKLVVISTPFKRNGWVPEVLVGMGSMNAEMAIGSPMHAAYASAAPRSEDWPKLVDKTRQLLGKDYDWSKGVAAIKAPTLIAVGDADSISLAYAAEMFALRGGSLRNAGWEGLDMSTSQLAILLGSTHYNIYVSPVLASIVKSFLDMPMSVTM